MKEKDILAHKMSISFHPDDNSKLNYQTAFNIAKEFAERYFHSKGYEVLLAVHTDTEHIHAHFLISNCNMDTGKSYQRNQKDLHEMSEFFEQQCLDYGLINSVRDSFYNHDLETAKDKNCLAEKQMKKRGVETFKDELRDVIQQEIADPANKTFDDVIKALMTNWNVETRVAGNTISYRHPEYRDKNNNLVSVRGSKLGEIYTRKGIEHYVKKKQRKHENYLPEAGGRTAGSDIGTDSYRTEGGRNVQQNQSTTETGNEFAVAARGHKQFMDENVVNAGGERQRSGGQVSSIFDVVNDESSVSSIDRFYDRYTRRAENAKQQAIEAAERAEPVRKKRKSQCL